MPRPEQVTPLIPQLSEPPLESQLIPYPERNEITRDLINRLMEVVYQVPEGEISPEKRIPPEDTDEREILQRTVDFPLGPFQWSFSLVMSSDWEKEDLLQLEIRRKFIDGRIIPKSSSWTPENDEHLDLMIIDYKNGGAESLIHYNAAWFELRGLDAAGESDTFAQEKAEEMITDLKDGLDELKRQKLTPVESNEHSLRLINEAKTILAVEKETGRHHKRVPFVSQKEGLVLEYYQESNSKYMIDVSIMDALEVEEYLKNGYLDYYYIGDPFCTVNVLDNYENSSHVDSEILVRFDHELTNTRFAVRKTDAFLARVKEIAASK